MVFKELFLSVFVGIVVGFILFSRTRLALQQRFEHSLRDKYAKSSHFASKYPQLQDDILDVISAESGTTSGQIRFSKPSAFTDPLFNPKSAETGKLTVHDGVSLILMLLPNAQKYYGVNLVDYSEC